MDGSLLIVVAFVVGLVVLDLVALRFGVDSRPRPGERADW